MKSCIACAEVKSLRGFYKHPRNADGYFGACMECVRTANLARYHRLKSAIPPGTTLIVIDTFNSEERRA
jgi:hypothetical protein